MKGIMVLYCTIVCVCICICMRARNRIERFAAAMNLCCSSSRHLSLSLLQLPIAVVQLLLLVSTLPLSLLLTITTTALDNGVALTPPMGFNSYMAGAALQNEVGLLRAAEFMLRTLPPFTTTTTTTRLAQDQSDDTNANANANTTSISSMMRRRKSSSYSTRKSMRSVGYRYINTDEGWEESTRDASSGTIRWNATLYPSGMPAFVEQLHNKSFYFGIYGAASAVTCGGGNSIVGQLYHERHDAAVLASWGVDFLKSDNCANYALDPSVRYRAMRDALNATGRPMVLSIEPFGMHPDPAQSSEVANMWRTGVDIEGTWDAMLDRADVADKWAPLAGPKAGWNDPDMINVHGGLTLGENRVYFGLWAIMKAPLLISTDLLNLDRSILDIITNTEVIEMNQDVLGIPARKVLIDGLPVPWKVDVEDCAFPDQSLQYSRRVAQDRYGMPRAGPGVVDTRRWNVVDTGSSTGTMLNYEITNQATGRCLTQSNGTTVVLLPCTGARSQLWMFDKGITTVTSITNVEVNLALAISASALYSQIHGRDNYPVSDRAYGKGGLILVKPMDQDDSCDSRSCENYHPEQMWYYSPVEGRLRHSLFTSSINHLELQNQDKQDGYILTSKVPTFRHDCLAHVLSTANTGTESGTSEVWTGFLAGGSIVVGFVNRGHGPATISIPLDALSAHTSTSTSTTTTTSTTSTSTTTTSTTSTTTTTTTTTLTRQHRQIQQSYLVRDAWKARDLFVVHSGEIVQLEVLGHDMAVLRLIPLSGAVEPLQMQQGRAATTRTSAGR